MAGLLLEELLYISSNATDAEQVFQLVNGPVAFSPALTIYQYIEDILVTSNCNGTATDVLWTIDFWLVKFRCCSKSTPLQLTVSFGDSVLTSKLYQSYSADPAAVPPSAVSSIFAGAHTDALRNVTSLLGLGSYVRCGGIVPARSTSLPVAASTAVASITMTSASSPSSAATSPASASSSVVSLSTTTSQESSETSTSTTFVVTASGS